MNRRDELREHIIAAAVENIPRLFLEDFAKRAVNAYRDTYQEVAHNPTLLPEQKLASLRQTRPFRMEWEMAQSAKACGIPCTTKPLADNDWRYAYAVSGVFGFTQSYVPVLGALPQPAKFRDALAEAARIPELNLEDLSTELFLPRQYYGLLAHNPLGHTFTEDHQKFGSLQLCVPFIDMKGWALEIGVWELISRYPTATKKAVASTGPSWKTAVEKKEGDGS